MKFLNTFTLLFIILYSSSALAAFDSSEFNSSQGPLEVVRITPSGIDVPPSRQIVISFNRPVVPVGRMERESSEIPITIEPVLECEWRWLNTSSLACQLTEKGAMATATRYRLKMEPSIATEDGTVIKETLEHEFITQRPKVRSKWFKNWLSPGTPVIEVTFNQSVEEKSVKQHVFFWARGGKRVKAKLLSDDASHHYNAGQRWLVSPAEELPLDSTNALSVEPGIASLGGPEKGVEDRYITTFDTFPEFEFIGVKCYTIEDKEVFLSPGSLFNFSRCNPLRGAFLNFTAPVSVETLKEHLEVNPDLAGGRKDYDPWANVSLYSRLSGAHRKHRHYSIRLPEALKAYETYSLSANGANIKDQFGRSLSKKLEIDFLTDHRKPDYSFNGPFFVLEKGVDTEVPIMVTNIEKIKLGYKTDTAWGRGEGEKVIDVPEAQDISFRMPLGVRELLGRESGVISSSLDTEPHIKQYGYGGKWFHAQVSPYNVHVKAGHFNTLVWVSDFATGEPVANVSVDIYLDTLKTLGQMQALLAEGVTDSNGIAILPGIEKIDPSLELLNKSRWNYYEHPRMFVRCAKGSDMAVLPLVYPFEVRALGANEEYINTSLSRRYGHIHTWGTTAQGVYKLGDTIQYKFYVRNQDNMRFVPAPKGKYSLKVVDPMGKTVHEEKEIKLSEFGAYDGEIVVPKNGAVGWYSFQLKSSFKAGTWEPIRVLVSDFTPAPFRVTTELNGELFKIGDNVKVMSFARLHAGGPYLNAKARITARMTQTAITPKDSRAKGFYFDSHMKNRGTWNVHQTEGTLDDKGDMEIKFKLADHAILHGRLAVETAVRDDRGKYVASESSAAYVGRNRFVGIRQPDWVLKEDESSKIEAVVINEFGKSVKGTEIKFKIEYQKTTASRVKGAGNAYLTKYHHEWIGVSECELESTSEPVLCNFSPEEPGVYRLTASINDTKGRSHSSSIRRWAIGKGRVLWESRPGNTMRVFPEKEEVKIGETARYMIQNPFPGAKALITIERYGVLKSWIETFEDSTEIVEFPVLPDYLPGYYLSIVIMSPRVDKPLDENGVDLGKPSFRMGYVPVQVKDPYKEIKLNVSPQRDVYKPRDKVKVDIQAKLPPSKREHDRSEIELAVAVLDESVFDLISGGRRYFDPYKGFYYLEPLDLKNFDLLLNLVGRQKFEKKGADTGGGGGMDLNLRSVFKFVTYWNPSIKTDKDGKASIEFEVPDNLTGWRVLVMAVTPDDRMGLGEGVFKVNRPTELRPALPNQVLEGDSFDAAFTVMNRTDERRTLEVRLDATGPLVDEQGAESSTIVIAEPYKRYKVWLPVRTKNDGEIIFTAVAGDISDRDALEYRMPVRKRVSLTTAATYGTTTRSSVEERVEFPGDIRTDAGSVSVSASASVISNLEGAFKYMKDYPYICWEQMLSKGVMAAHYRNLRSYLPDTIKWENAKAVTDKTLSIAAEHQAPNGGMVYYIPENRYVSPYLSAYTALAFNWLKESGFNVPTEVEDKLHDYLLKLLRKDATPDFYSKGMSSTVRAVALAALAANEKVSRNDVLRYEGHIKEMSLFGKAHYLDALMRVKRTEPVRKKVVDMILSHANQTGGKFIFSEAIDTRFQRILATPLRDNCAVLNALLDYSETPEGSRAAGEIPFKLVRTITQTRGNREHWENTQENMFCMNSLVRYMRVYENVKPDFEFSASMDKKIFGKSAFKSVRDEAVTFERPIEPGDPGRKATVKIERKGTGRAYYSTRVSYATKELKAKPENAGIEVRREYSLERNGKWRLMDRKMKLKAGDLVRVDIYVSLPTARNFVVVEDPVPGGLEPVNRDLATASNVDADKGEFKHAGGSFWYKHDDWIDYGLSRWSFYHKEMRHHAVRFYSEYLSAGNYHLSYTAQAIAPGEFTILPLKAEEMYDPDVFGKGVPAVLEVEKTKD